MKKSIFLSIFAVLTLVLAVIPVSAKSPAIKGEVTAINGNVVTVVTMRGETLNVTSPADFDVSTLNIGDTIIVKGENLSDSSIIAEWVKSVGPGSAEDENAPEGSKSANSAYCAGKNKQHPHPFATAMAEDYGITEEWVMEYFCEGYSMGAILLALKTQQIDGTGAADLLSLRAGGQGWGAIWQGLHLIGSERDVETPPGWLHKPGHDNP